MAKITFTSTTAIRSLNMDPATTNMQGLIFDYDFDSATATRLTLYNSTVERAVFYGTGMSFGYTNGEIDEFLTGRITDIYVLRGSTTVLSMTGLDITPNDFQAVNTMVEQMALFNGGSDLIKGGTYEDTLVGGTGSDSVYGNGGADRISGDSSVDRLYGGTGSDTIAGGTSGDVIYGNDGNDVIYGGTGNDSLSGGVGADKFVFNTTATSTNVDQLTSFATGNDEIAFDNDIFTALGVAGNLATSQFRAGTAATDGTDRIIYDKASGRIWYDRDGNGTASKILVAEVPNGTVVVAGDFLILA